VHNGLLAIVVMRGSKAMTWLQALAKQATRFGILPNHYSGTQTYPETNFFAKITRRLLDLPEEHSSRADQSVSCRVPPSMTQASAQLLDWNQRSPLTSSMLLSHISDICGMKLEAHTWQSNIKQCIPGLHHAFRAV
jgi:hypothetical protein